MIFISGAYGGDKTTENNKAYINLIEIESEVM